MKNFPLHDRKTSIDEIIILSNDTETISAHAYAQPCEETIYHICQPKLRFQQCLPPFNHQH